MNYTYILKCADGTFYCGWTNCLEKRVKAHNAGTGAKYTKPRRPVTLVYYEEFETKKEAMSREAAVKRMTRSQKEKLIARGSDEGTGSQEQKKAVPFPEEKEPPECFMLRRRTS